MQEIDRTRLVLLIVIAALIAAALGYAFARLTVHPSPATTASTLSESATPSGNGSETLEIPAAFLTTMGIVVEPVTSGNLSAEIHAPATVSTTPNGQAMVAARAAGTLTRLNKRLGDEVKPGEVLALIESRDAAAMAAERAIAESKVELARSILKREQALYEQKVTPRQDFETAQAQLTAAEAELARAKSAAEAAGVSRDGRSLGVVSPIAGRITASRAALGAYVEPGAELFQVSDPRFVLIEAAVPAMDARRIHSGDAARVVVASGVPLDATVMSITPALNEQTRSATVTLSLASKQTALTPGEFVQVRITPKQSNATGVVVPEEAIQNIGSHEVVFVRAHDSFKVTRVIVGARSGGRAAILSGLQTGDTIATRNAFLLKAEIGKGAEEEE